MDFNDVTKCKKEMIADQGGILATVYFKESSNSA